MTAGGEVFWNDFILNGYYSNRFIHKESVLLRCDFEFCVLFPECDSLV